MIMKYFYSLLMIVLVSCKPQYLNLQGKELLFEETFKTLENFKVEDQTFYNDNDVWFSRDMVSISDSGLVIKCIKDTLYHEDWRLKKITNWTSGMVSSRGRVEFIGGIWIIEAKLNSNWPALWLLKPDFYVENIGYKIIPEIDIVETIHNNFRHTVHYGFSKETYRDHEMGRDVCNYDNKFHEFAVEMLFNGYDFYIDRKLTARFISDDPEFISNQPNYLIINNAATSEDSEETLMIVKSIKIYK